MLEKTATIKIFEYLPLGSKLKKQTDIAKDEYKSFKSQINVNNNNREDYVRSFNIFDEIQNECIKSSDNPRTPEEIDIKCNAKVFENYRR